MSAREDRRVSVITGNEAAATAAKLARVQVIAAYPITPQSPVVEQLSAWVESGELPAEFVTVESEHSALTVCITASTVGARVFTATSANGLAYMTEQVWWAAGARLPIVMCVANRAMAAPWNVLNDQQDSMSVRDAGWVQLYCRDNQEILDTTAAGVPHRRAAPRAGDGLLRRLPALAHRDAGRGPRRRDGRRVPAAVHDAAHRRRPGRPAQHRPGHASPTRAPTRDGVVRPGYMEIRAAAPAALLEALDVIPAVDAELGARTGRAWGGLTWEYLLDDAEVVLVAAGSLGMQLTVAAEQLRAAGRQGRACSASARTGRSRPRRCATSSPGARARARLRQGAELRLRGSDLRRPARRAARRAGAPPVFGRGLRARRPRRLARRSSRTPSLRALADGHAGVRASADRLDQPASWTGGAQ